MIKWWRADIMTEDPLPDDRNGKRHTFRQTYRETDEHKGQICSAGKDRT